VEAARMAGITKVLVPKENWQEIFETMDIEVIPVEDIHEIMDIVFALKDDKAIGSIMGQQGKPTVLTATALQ